MGYDFEFKYDKGKDLVIADALSRSQTTSQNRSKFEHEIETTPVVHEGQRVTSSLAEIAEPTAHGTELQSVVHHISKGWTNNKRNVPLEILPYWSIKNKLSVKGGIVYRNDRIVRPVALRKTLNVKLHQTTWVQNQPLDGQNILMVAKHEQPTMQFIAICEVSEVCNAFKTKNQKETDRGPKIVLIFSRTISTQYWLTTTVTGLNLT